MRVSQNQINEFARRMPGMGTDPASVRARVEAMEAMLEGLFVIPGIRRRVGLDRSEEHTSELQSLMRISYAVFCLTTKKTTSQPHKQLLDTLLHETSTSKK